MKVLMSTHKFSKTNLMTLKNNKGHYDEYQCEDCGLKGKRYGIGSDVVEVTRDKKCKAAMPEPSVFAAKIVKLRLGRNDFGFTDGELKLTVPCPLEYIDKYSDDTWVFSKKRSEPVRLFSTEYSIYPLKPQEWFAERKGKEIIAEWIETGETEILTVCHDFHADELATMQLTKGIIYED